MRSFQKLAMLTAMLTALSSCTSQVADPNLASNVLGRDAPWGWLKLSTGWYGSCGIYRSRAQQAEGVGELYCWGSVQGMPTGSNKKPLAPPDNSLWRQVSVGHDHMCGVTSKGNLYCIGNNQSGQVNGVSKNETISKFSQPIGFDQTLSWRSVVAGTANTFAIDDTQRLWVWGEFDAEGGAETSLTPLPASLAGNVWKLVGSQVANTFNPRLLAIDDADILYQSEADKLEWSQMPETWALASAGLNHWCLLGDNKGLICCQGDNSQGQIGDNTTIPRLTKPSFLEGDCPFPNNVGATCHDTSWSTVSSGSNHSCAIRRDDAQLFCWGRNVEGQLGLGDSKPFLTPKPIRSILKPDAMTTKDTLNIFSSPEGRWREVSAGNNFTCGILDAGGGEGALYCWGDASWDKLGMGAIVDRPGCHRHPNDKNATYCTLPIPTKCKVGISC